MLSSTNPKTGRTWSVSSPASGVEDVDRLVRDAVGAAEVLAASGTAGRASMLRSIADELDADGEKIVTLADEETGLGVDRLTGELARTSGQFRLFAEVLDDGGYLEATIDHATESGPDLRRMLVPVGPVAVFAASNFPLAFSVAGGDTASALAAGCPVVVKGHQAHPATSLAVHEAAKRGLAASGTPAAALGLLFGREAGVRLVEHPQIKAVGFTGSLSGGRALFDIAQGRPEPIPFYGELGALNSLVVAPGAAAERGDRLARELAGSATLGMGQFCTKPGLALIPAGAAGDDLIAGLRQEFAAHAGGVLLSASIKDAFDREVRKRVSAPGVQLLTQGIAQSGGGFTAQATLLVVPPAELTGELLDECFGPLLVVSRYSSEAELTAALDRLPGALTATVHATDADRTLMRSVLPVLEARVGRLVWNGYPTGVAVNWAQHHGGPWPAATGSAHTSVGASAIRRFLRPVAWQNTPPEFLPAELRDEAVAIPRRVDGALVM
ncbi:aldehyde dehydrogenase (NADP(+)) [Streptomyces antimycoticus]